MEQEILKATLPLLLTGNLLAVFPYKINESGNFVINPIPAIYSFIIFIFSIYNLFYLSIWPIFLKLNSTIHIYTIEERLFVVCKLLEGIIFFVSFISTQFDVKNNTTRLQTIFKSCYILNDYGINLNFKNLEYSFLKSYVSFYLFLIIIFIIDYYITLGGSYFKLTTLSWIMGNIVIVFNLLLSYQLACVIDFYTFLIINVNEEIKIIGKRKIIKNKNKKNNYGIDYIWVPARKRLFILTYAYNDFVKMLESAFYENRSLILLIVITCMIGVTGNLYTIIAMIIDTVFKKISINWYILTHSLFWCVLTIGKVAILVSSASYATEQVSLVLLFAEFIYNFFSLFMKDV